MSEENETTARIRAVSAARTFVGKPGDKVPSDPLARTVTVYEVATGKQFLVWPVDARQMCQTGAFTLDPPSEAAVEEAAPAAEAAPEASPTTPSRRKAKG